MDWLSDFAGALRFFSRLPIPGPMETDDFRRSLRLAPLAGALLGLAGGLVFVAALGLRLPAAAAALLALGFGALVTGALHEDGLADVADGFGGGLTRDRKLEIMKDSRIGAFGASRAGSELRPARQRAGRALAPAASGALLVLIAAGADFALRLSGAAGPAAARARRRLGPGGRREPGRGLAPGFPDRASARLPARAGRLRRLDLLRGARPRRRPPCSACAPSPARRSAARPATSPARRSKLRKSLSCSLFAAARFRRSGASPAAATTE